jgi:hypothetical protein
MERDDIEEEAWNDDIEGDEPEDDLPYEQEILEEEDGEVLKR